MYQIMKTFRSSLPAAPPQDLQFQAWKLDSSPGAPQLSLTNLPTLNMDGTPFSRPQTSISSPNLLAQRPVSAPRPNEPSPSPSPSQTLQTPAPNRLQKHRTPSQRKPFTTTTHSSSPAMNIPSPSPSPAPEDGATPDPDNTSPWCGAVGRATLGKSGRVIERLMADIDKLKRELNAEVSRRQEIEKRENVSSRAVDGLRAENANLELAKEVDAGVLKRRDRKIEELRAELDAERERRAALELEKHEAERARDEAVARELKEVGEAREVAKHAAGHAEVLELSHRQLATEYRQRSETFARDLGRLTDDRDEERRKVKRLDVVVEQLKRETERTGKLGAQMGEAFDAYKESAESRIADMEATERRRDEEESQLREETKRIVGEARWLINIGRNASKRSEYLPLDEQELTS